MKERRQQSHLSFRLMALAFRLRDALWPPVRILQEAGVKPGMTVLDFGCGPGSFTLAAAGLVGPEGRVYAFDIHPLALASVRRGAAKRSLNNVHAIDSGALGGIPHGSVDLILLYDVLHDIPGDASALANLRQLLKLRGVLSVSDHHLKENTLIAAIANGGLFIPAGRGRWTYRFVPAKSSEAAP